MIGKQSYVRPIYMIAPCKGLQGDAVQSAANQDISVFYRLAR